MLHLRGQSIPGGVRSLQILVHAHVLHGQQGHAAAHHHHQASNDRLGARYQPAPFFLLDRGVLGIAHFTTAQIAITEEMTHNATGTIS